MIQLSDDDVKALAPALTRVQARVSQRIDVVDLLRRWDTFVAEVERGYELTGYDYVNDLATRDLLDEIVGSAPPRLRDRITSQALDALDQRFRRATREVTKPLQIATPERPRWWWFRAPLDVTGELASDLFAQ